MYIHNLNPVLVNIGFIEIKWYSLAYIFGILIGWWLAKKILAYKSKDLKLTLNSAHFDDPVSYLIIAVILGGRIGYVLFYNLEYYLVNPFSIFKIWEGGMSFHGALIGIIISTIFFANKKNINTFLLLDLIACVSPIGIFFGRIANFINAELYGKPTDLYWSVIFPTIDNIQRHPSQLYEALLEGVLLFIILISIMNKKSIQTGFCSSYFLIFYGIFRIIAEQFREPDIQIGYLFKQLSMGSFLSVIMIFFGIIILIMLNRNVLK